MREKVGPSFCSTAKAKGFQSSDLSNYISGISLMLLDLKIKVARIACEGIRASMIGGE